MKRTPKGAPAPKFLVISDSQYYTTYTGTRDQLLSRGLARAEHFPEGSKRTSYFEGADYDSGLKIKKIRGGRFELMKWHPRRSPVQPVALKEFFIYPRSDSDSGYGFRVHIPGINPEVVREELNDAVTHILAIAKDAQRDAGRQRLSLITSRGKSHLTPVTATIGSEEKTA